MALIGDPIISTRSKIPDRPQVFPAPGIVSAVASAGTALPLGNWFVVATLINNWGETLASAEMEVTTTVGLQNITVNLGFPGPSSNLLGVRIYFGTTPGGEAQYQQFTPASSTVVVNATTNIGTPPTTATAYLPDSDGQMFSAFTLYQWLNEGLSEFSRVTGGVLDYCGVPTTVGQPMYILPGHWLEISDVWYGGYWIQGGKRAEFFRRNTVNSSVLNRVTISVSTNQQVIEVSYQPDRSSGVTVTTNDMQSTDASVGIADPSQFLLPFGFAQIGTEIVAYASVAGPLGGLIRSLGASTAQFWPSGTVVTELSLFWCGKRTFGIKYIPGQGLTTLQAPHGWSAILPTFMLAQAKKAEQDMKAASDLEKEFFSQAQQWYLSNKGVTRFVQVGGSMGPLVFNQDVPGGIIIP